MILSDFSTIRMSCSKFLCRILASSSLSNKIIILSNEPTSSKMEHKKGQNNHTFKNGHEV